MINNLDPAAEAKSFSCAGDATPALRSSSFGGAVVDLLLVIARRTLVLRLLRIPTLARAVGWQRRVRDVVVVVTATAMEGKFD